MVLSHPLAVEASSVTANAPLYSTLAGDPDLGELVEMFIDEMPQRIATLSGFLDSHDWEGLGRFAHQMKGAAGSYGFDQVTPVAAKVEHAARQGEPEEKILAALERLISICGRLRAGEGV